jgi:hypothetical protein
LAGIGFRSFVILEAPDEQREAAAGAHRKSQRSPSVRRSNVRARVGYPVDCSEHRDASALRQVFGVDEVTAGGEHDDVDADARSLTTLGLHGILAQEKVVSFLD